MLVQPSILLYSLIVTISNDLGLIPMTEVSRTISGLIPGQKYTLLTEHYKPDHSFWFPKFIVMCH